jgi:hypothetical protein
VKDYESIARGIVQRNMYQECWHPKWSERLIETIALALEEQFREGLMEAADECNPKSRPEGGKNGIS